MKAKVIRAFTDKHTGETYKAGTFYESNDSERIEELHNAEYVIPVEEDVVKVTEEVVEDKPKSKPKKKKKADK